MPVSSVVTAAIYLKAVNDTSLLMNIEGFVYALPFDRSTLINNISTLGTLAPIMASTINGGYNELYVVSPIYESTRMKIIGTIKARYTPITFI